MSGLLFFFYLQKRKTFVLIPFFSFAFLVDRLDTSTWKVMDSRRAGINWSKISPSTQMVLKILQRKGKFYFHHNNG